MLWASYGDRNSKFFHSHATQRKMKNSIVKIRTWDGSWTTSEEEVAECFLKYYKELFTSAHTHPCDTAIDSIHTILSDEMNAQLSFEFKEWEVQQAIKQMAPLKALGLDGMSSLFY